MQLQSGTLLQGGKYKIETVLGQGGFGITYLATQVALERKVAIKEFFMTEHCNRDVATSHVSVGSQGSQELVARFRQKFVKEARMIAGLNHPHIIRIIDVFEENGTAYYVMEYMGNGSLAEYGISYRQVDLLPDGEFDWDGIEKALNEKTKLVTIQRSKGYASRQTLSVKRIGELIHFIKERKPDVLCMVDNCYGEFVEIEEPSQVGADLIVGSLIKNPGGGLAPIGGYLCGTKECIDRAAYRLTSPGLGKEVGATLGVTTSLTQGLFLAPTVVKGALKGAVFAANIYEKLGFKVIPDSKESRHDIIQEVEFHDPELMVAFCEGIQAAAPVDSFVRPEPWDMPGYDAQVIMAAGAFVSGSSIELSADGPMKEPYAVYFQGGLTWEHAKYGIMMSLQKIYETGKLKNILINDTES